MDGECFRETLRADEAMPRSIEQVSQGQVVSSWQLHVSQSLHNHECQLPGVYSESAHEHR